MSRARRRRLAATRPAAPGRAPVRYRASPAAARSPVQPADFGRGALGGGGLLEPEDLAQQREPRVPVLAFEVLQARRRLVQQPIDDRPRERLDPLEVAL